MSPMLSGDVIELLIYHQPSVKPSLTLRPFGILGYVAGHSLTDAGELRFWVLEQAYADSLATQDNIQKQINGLLHGFQQLEEFM